jgi:hypothetical protein
MIITLESENPPAPPFIKGGIFFDGGILNTFYGRKAGEIYLLRDMAWACLARSGRDIEKKLFHFLFNDAEIV